MSWHVLKAYIRYKKQAKTRHGVHSPFAYDFVENVLHNKAHIPDKDLQERIAIYYKTNPVYLHLTNTDPLRSFNELLPELANDSIVIIPDIHAAKQNEKTWQQLATHPRVTMSLDLYKIGLLLFKAEFKVKQHFVLK